ncbi:MAG: hypothetical protein ACLTR8_03265 [Oscillospiraceae bacterium]
MPRVKAAVAWHKPTGWEKAGKWCACVLVFLFFVGGPRDIPYLSQKLVRYWQREAVEVTVPSGWAPEALVAGGWARFGDSAGQGHSGDLA